MMAVCGNTLWLLGGVVEVWPMHKALLQQLALLECHTRRPVCQIHSTTAGSNMLQSSGLRLVVLREVEWHAGGAHGCDPG